MESPFFSIVIPSYNRALILPETIGSVLTQSYTNWELLVIDDGSADNTKEVVESIADNRVKYIYQDNAERSAARNNGIRNSKGEYICFLDSDDLFEANHLEVLYDKISEKSFPEELFFTNCYYLNHGEKEKPEFPDLKDNSIAYLLQHSIIPARVCIHRNLLNKFQFREDIVIVEDTVLWVSIANKYPVTHITDYTIQYRLHDDNSVNIKNNCFLPRLKGLKKLFKDKEISEKVGKKMRKDIISNCYLGIAKHYEYKRSFFKMVSNLCISFFVQPISVQNKFKLYMIYRYLTKGKNA